MIIEDIAGSTKQFTKTEKKYKMAKYQTAPN